LFNNRPCGLILDMKTLFYFFIFVSFVQAHPSLAKDIYVKCIQNQIADSGGDPGPIDGVLGGQTRRALSELTDIAPDLQALPKLTHRTAVTWCRELGTVTPSMRTFMPSVQGAAVFVGEDQHLLESRMTHSLRGAKLYYKRKYDIELASKDVIIASNSGKTITDFEKQAAKEVNGGILFRNKAVNERCARNKEGRFNATAWRHVIIFCFHKNTAFNLEWSSKSKAKIDRVMVHEYMHMIQRELMADKVPLRIKKGQRRRLGPSWMIEGTANYFEWKFFGDIYGRPAKNSLLAKFANKPEKGKKRVITLRQLRDKQLISSEQDYATSHWAVVMLVNATSEQALFDYFRFYGEGLSWEKAFQKAFGISLNSFEKEFERRRKDVTKVVQFQIQN